MTCPACKRQREQILKDYKDGKYTGAARETIKGALMMAGVIRKGDEDATSS